MLGLLIASTLAASGAARQVGPQGMDWAGAALGISGPSYGGPVTTDDLLRLRDLGSLAVSPDGRWVAFSVHQADPSQDNYAVRWFVQPTDGSTPPTPLKVDGGDPIIYMAYGLPQSAILAEAAQWSPDSRTIAFRRRIGHNIELWTANISDGRAIRVYDGAARVERFVWSKAGDLVFRTGLNWAHFQQETAEEARHGLRLDARIPLFNSVLGPGEPDCGVEGYQVLSARIKEGGFRASRDDTDPGLDPACERAVNTVGRDGTVRPASAADTELVRGVQATEVYHTAERTRADGAAVKPIPVDPALAKAFSPLLRLGSNAPHTRPCHSPACIGVGFRDYGWLPGGQAVWFLKAEGSAGRPDGAPMDINGLYIWDLRTGEVRSLYRGSDLIADCHLLREAILCLRETVTRPAELVSFALAGGLPTVIANPNPMFESKVFPRVRRIMLKDFQGNPAYADIVYPNNYEKGRRYPLVVVQYVSKGFLRGGTGNEYPVFPLAANGFIVFSLNRPEDYNDRLRMAWMPLQRKMYGPTFPDRQSVLSAINMGLDELIQEGDVDDHRMAITGLSAGSESVHYTLKVTDRFRAAIASSVGVDPIEFALLPEGPFRDLWMQMYNSPTVIPPPGNPLYELSWAPIPERLRTPLLINAGANEVHFGLESIAALQHAHRPIDIRVFPDEMHIKYHPHSYVGVFENNMMWLEFWLQDKEDENPAFRLQYKRWEVMRSTLEHEKATGPSRGL